MPPNKTNHLARRASKSFARLVLCIVCVIPFLFRVSEVNAQTQPLLLLSPNPVIFYLNGATTQLAVDLLAQNVVNILGYDFVLNYDPEFLEFKKFTPSTWLSPLYALPSEITSGRIHFAYAQFGGTAVNGNDTLGTITFKAVQYGNSALTFSGPPNCKYGRTDGSEHQFSVQNGSVTFTYNPSIVTNSAVVGTFSLQGQTTTGGVPVNLAGGDYLHRGPFSGLSLNQSGSNFSIPTVVMDLYTVTTNQPRYLNIDAGCGKSKPVFGTTSTLSPLKLKGGNAVWADNVINMQDISKILGVYGEPSTVVTPLDADINSNGTVDVYDLAMAAGNYGLNCATAYANWMP